MKTLRFLGARMTATPIILGPGRSGHVLTGYYPDKRKGKPKESQVKLTARTT